MLRDIGPWCRLEADGILEVHVGGDQYLYVCTNWPSEGAVARTRGLGLFPERLDASPYAVETGLPGVQRPADAEFWSALAWAVGSGRAGLLEETYIEGVSRWLVHNSELTGSPGEEPQLGIEVGSALRVKILDVNLERRRITLSQRQAATEV
ncbi:S1 RNA-binding domain-containing protein [Streptomyces sp. IBSNAI001]|uniref:S1 RNA-binding domain-containing protein n=1 Tax=Streptomyces sp. IBSNAI001 TaxID=3457499 RepID=UPI003FD44841